MNLIFISLFLTNAFCVFLFIFLFLKIEKLEEKQEKEYQHLLKNIKHIGNFLEENSNIKK